MAGDVKGGNPRIKSCIVPDMVMGCANNNKDIMVFSFYGDGDNIFIDKYVMSKLNQNMTCMILLY